MTSTDNTKQLINKQEHRPSRERGHFVTITTSSFAKHLAKYLMIVEAP